MRYVVKLWKAWTGWKYAWKFSKFNFLQCFRPKEWEKVVVNMIFSVWEDSTIVWVSLVRNSSRPWKCYLIDINLISHSSKLSDLQWYWLRCIQKQRGHDFGLCPYACPSVCPVPPKKVPETENFAKQSCQIYFKGYIKIFRVMLGEGKPSYIYSILKPHFRVSSPPQSRSQAVVCVSTPMMYPRSGYFLVMLKNQAWI